MITINNNWFFKKLNDCDFLNTYSLEKINKDDLSVVNLPHTWYQDGKGYKGTVLYERSLEIKANPNKRFFLEFEAADRYAKVFINNKYVGKHLGGYQAFTFDISNFLSEGVNTLTVLLDNRDFGIISPLAGDFTIFGGIYRNVNIYEKELVCFDRSFYGTTGLIVKTTYENEMGFISLNPHLVNVNNESIEINYLLIDKAEKVVLNQINKAIDAKLKIDNPIAWDGKTNPYLYTLKANLTLNGRIKDTVTTTIGFKNIRVDSNKGFFLNDKHLLLCGVAKHQDQGSIYNQTTERNLFDNLSDIKEIGANSVRLSHYQHPQKMYELCDENGLIVWAEIPMLKFTENEELFNNAVCQIYELIYQNIHHASIAFWGIQNEIAMFGESKLMYERMKELNDLVHKLDDSRISACANLNSVKNDSSLNKITDAVGYNVYYGWYYGEMSDTAKFLTDFHNDNPNLALGITEYGVDCNPLFHSDKPVVKDYTEDYQALYHETIYPYFKECDFLFGSYIWNLYDFNSEIRDEGKIKFRNTKGIITSNREIKKDAFYYYKAQWQIEPFVKLAQRRYVNRVAGSVTIKAYSNENNMFLSVNGDKYELESDTGVFLFENISINLGENKIIAYTNNNRDEMIINGVKEADKSYIYVDERPGLNVRNWFTDLLEEEKFFPKDCYSLKDTGDTIKACEEAMRVIGDFSPFLAESLKERGGTMPLDRILFHMKGLLTDEQCKEMNKKLITIKK